MVDCDGINELALINYEGASLHDAPPETKPEHEQHHDKVVVNPWDMDPHVTEVPMVELNSAGNSFVI